MLNKTKLVDSNDQILILNEPSYKVLVYILDQQLNKKNLQDCGRRNSIPEGQDFEVLSDHKRRKFLDAESEK